VARYVLAFFISKMYSSIKHLDVLAVQRLDARGQDVMDEWLGCIG